jgi:molybdopterin-binding protein
MNRFVGNVVRIDDQAIMTQIWVEIEETTLQIIKSKRPEWLHEGDLVLVGIREMQVCVGQACDGKLSIINKIPATLVALRSHQSLCELRLDTPMGEVVSLMTQQAFDALELEVDASVTVLLRETDISLEPEEHAPVLLDPSAARTEVASGYSTIPRSSKWQ